jgi:hypothetical protein
MEARQDKPKVADEISEKRFVLIDETVAKFSQRVLNKEAWFLSANELVAAMKLLEPQIEDFWRSIGIDVEVTDAKNSGPGPEHSLINVHMMLAGFAIENLCKGFLVGRLGSEQLAEVKSGKLPDLWRNHDILEFVQSTGMALTEREKDLLKRIADAIWWRGRYPSPTYHKKLKPFWQWSEDVPKIRNILENLRAHVGAKDCYRCQDPNVIAQAPWRTD